ncbi:hypothetical protein ACFQZS_14850 [Mucilaginibacter calamicampi]|uniref:Lipoprotein n=1 Tax=Mucilaginibacter calamicampi TaxID=1302352 RepID=A0ABW2YYI6_9SPHI
MKTILNFKLLLTALLLTASISACKKNDQPFTEAKVINAGAVAADGCGWVIRIGDTNYSPTNLADQFKETELKVSIRYQTLSSKFQCGWGQQITEIKLVDIKKR